MSHIDLHIHSNCSDDGEFSPESLVLQCRELGMELVAIADHNSVRGVGRAQAAASGLRVISGVELDCTYGGKNFHLLGYGFDHTDREFEAVEQEIFRQEKDAAQEKVRLFRKATGIPVNLVEIIAASKNGIVTGELIAEFVLAGEEAERYEILKPYLPGGAKSDMPHVRIYWDFFSEGKPAYVPIHYLSLPDAVDLIHRTGGAAVLAHPGQNLKGDHTLLPGMIGAGIDGIEVFSSYHSREEAAGYLELARQNHLLVTCGSDFHGKHKPQIRLGGHGSTLEDRQLLKEMGHLM